MQREVYQDFDLILKACEKATYDFDIESGWMTSVPLSDTELEKQLHQLLVSNYMGVWSFTDDGYSGTVLVHRAAFPFLQVTHIIGVRYRA